MPTVVHGRPPPPFVSPVFQQQAHEPLHWILWQETILRILPFEPLNHFSGVCHPAAIAQLQRRHLPQANGFFERFSLAG
jgi:hypothetical protein